MTTASRNRPAFTRGKPFAQGNPGKPKGARHRTTIVAEKLMQDDADAIVQAVIEKAKAGDMVAARIVLDRIVPIRKGAVVQIALPAAKTAEDVSMALATLIQAMADGEVTPDEAATIGSVLEIRRRAIETLEFDERLKKLEEAKNGK
jgi:phage tail sheath gpL-like